MRRCGTIPAALAAARIAAIAAIAAAHAIPAVSAARPGSIAADSLLMPTEAFVLTRDDLADRNIHTIDDIIALLPGVFRWREGPAGAYEGFSVEGRSPRGVNFFVNGHPVVDPYRLEAIMRFLPLSRLERIEVVYSGSPAFTGDLSSRGAVNLVIEEGGREAPTSELNFTYGGAKRRARRAWFASPRAHAGGALAYDEYLQDGIECIPGLPGRIVGKYDSRSILAELFFERDPGENLLVRFHRYEDTSVGTIVGSQEDVRWSGFASLVSYRRRSLEVSVREQVLKLSRWWTDLDAAVLAGSARWSGSAGPVGVRAFATVEDARFENEIQGAAFGPSYRRFEGGAAFGGALPSGVNWRLGAWGGRHDGVGAYGGGEAALGKAWSESVSQDIVVARRLRVPSAQELYQPAIARVPGADTFSTAGAADLAPEISNEISLGFRAPHLALSLFGRSESSLITLAGGSRAVYRSTGSGLVAGARGRLEAGRRILGVDCALAVSGEAYPEREALADGVPAYRALAEIGFKRRILGGTELLSAGLAAEFAGKRSWPAGELPPYRVLDLRSSLTIMSARVSFELRNLLDEPYETAAGFRMPGRYYTIGVFWELLD
jgi:outer membrane cobalamin receptor